jgi:hypothetical protein
MKQNKIKFLLIFILVCQSDYLQAYGKKTNIEKCIEKNVKNILTFKIPTPSNFSLLKIKVTEKMKQNLKNVFPGANSEILYTRTIGEMIEIMGLSDQETIDALKQMQYTDEISQEDKKMVNGLMDLFGSILNGYPDLLNENAENICNKQGIY